MIEIDDEDNPIHIDHPIALTAENLRLAEYIIAQTKAELEDDIKAMIPPPAKVPTVEDVIRELRLGGSIKEIHRHRIAITTFQTNHFNGRTYRQNEGWNMIVASCESSITVINPPPQPGIASSSFTVSGTRTRISPNGEWELLCSTSNCQSWSYQAELLFFKTDLVPMLFGNFF